MIQHLLDVIETVRPAIRELSDYLHDHPEIGFQEFEAAKRQCNLLESWGFQVTRGVAGLETAFEAVRKFGSGNGARFCILSEYDALKGMGHACGHNLICASAMAAGYAASRALEKAGIQGELCVMGTPAEEGKGGKVIMTEQGVFDRFHASIISHPYDLSSMDDGALSINHWRVAFHGVASHAGMAPEKGINALNAMIHFFNGIALWRQQLPENSRVHGIISKGGEAANIIPAYAESLFYVRAPDCELQAEMNRQFRAIAEAAALATGTTLECESDHGYQAIRFNRPLNEEYAASWLELGESIRRVNGSEGRGSTDFGNVSQMMPGANLHFGICGKEGVPLHSIEFREAAKTQFAFDQAMKTGAVMAGIACRYLSDEDFRNQVNDAFPGK